MKAISLTQPYATLISIGQKKIETRDWQTSYRGKLAIHAAKGLGPVGGKRGLRELCNEPPFWQVLRTAGYDDVDDLPRGCIVATCELIDCVSTSFPPKIQRFIVNRGVKQYVWELTDQERAFGDYSHGRFAWLLADVEMLPKPIPAKGSLGLWEWDEGRYK